MSLLWAFVYGTPYSVTAPGIDFPTAHFSPSFFVPFLLRHTSRYRAYLASSFTSPPLVTVMRFTFIIPALNEQIHLPRTLESIFHAVPPHLLGDILVIDNGSDDLTIQIAQAAGARPIMGEGLSLGALRNLGVSLTTEDVIVFLDADVALGETWAEGIKPLKDKLVHNPEIVSGAWCRVPASDSWIAHTWAQTDSRSGPVTHIGSGHLVVTRPAFTRIGGFDESLSTGEDYDLCVRASRIGIPVHAFSEFQAFHHGEPQTLRAFVRREFWHGTGDSQSISRTLRSRIALASIVFGMGHAVLTISLLTGSSIMFLIGFSMVSAPVAALTWRRRSSLNMGKAASLTLLLYLYLWARLLAIVLRRVFRSPGRRSPRSLQVHVRAGDELKP